MGLGWLDCFCTIGCNGEWADVLAAAAPWLEANGVLAMAAMLDAASEAAGIMLDVSFTNAALGGYATGS